jgi:histidinol-phosphate aminotransferase
MKIRFKPWIAGLPEYVAGKTMEEIKKEFNLSEVYKLASNENIMGPSPEVRDLIENYKYDLNYYPDSDCTAIRAGIARKLDLIPGNIIIGGGTDQIIEMICDCIIDRQDNIVIADPNFLIYEKATLKCGGSVIKVPLRDFRQDVAGIISAVNENTKIVFIASPHNPTGTIISKDEFEKLISAISKETLFVIDEAYYDYLVDKDRIGTIDYLKDYSNLMILRTFSKIYGLAGLRVGYGIADPYIISGLNKIRLPFNVSSIGQKAALVALENESYIEKVRDDVIREKEKFYSVLDEAGIGHIRSYANFILIKTGDAELEIVQELLKNGFIVRPGINLGVPGYIRVTISLPAINDRFLEKFTGIYKSTNC